jgi:hypothetical protein
MDPGRKIAAVGSGGQTAQPTRADQKPSLPAKTLTAEHAE